jgi:hypothetical protein
MCLTRTRARQGHAHARTRTRTNAHTHTRTHARTHALGAAHARTLPPPSNPPPPQEIFNLSVKAIKEDEEDVALQAVEFWSTLCDYELELEEGGSDDVRREGFFWGGGQGVDCWLDGLCRGVSQGGCQA